MYQRFKSFHRKNGELVESPDGFRAMTLRDYDRYLRLRADALAAARSSVRANAPRPPPPARRWLIVTRRSARQDVRPFVSNTGKPVGIDVVNELLYLMDVPLPSYFPEVSPCSGR